MKTVANNIRYFIFSTIYDFALQWFYYSKVKQLITKVNENPGLRILEIGVGTGITIPFYNPDKKITAVDCSLAMLKKAQKKLKYYPDINIQLLEYTAEECCNDIKNYDSVVFSNSLAVIRNPDELLNNYFNNLKVGSSIFILNHFTPENGLLYHTDKLLLPFGKILGFKSYFPLSKVINNQTMTNITVVKKGYWRIVQIKKQAKLHEPEKTIPV